MDNNVTITLDEYADLIGAAQNYELLTRAVYEVAEPTFLDKSRLTIDSNQRQSIMDVLRTIDRRRYEEVLDGLNSKAEQ